MQMSCSEILYIYEPLPATSVINEPLPAISVIYALLRRNVLWTSLE